MNSQRQGVERELLDEALFADEPTDMVEPVPLSIETILPDEPPPPAPLVRKGDCSFELTALSPGLYEVTRPNELCHVEPATEAEELPSPIRVELPNFDLDESYYDPENPPSCEWPKPEEVATIEARLNFNEAEESSTDEADVEPARDEESFDLVLDLPDVSPSEPTEADSPQPPFAIPIEEVSTIVETRDTQLAPSPQPLTLEINAGLTLAPGESVVLGSNALRVVGQDPFLLDLMLLSAPQQGVLLRDGFALNGGDAFTQEDLDHGRIVYRHEGEIGEDGFVFATPQEEIPPTTFSIRIEPAHHAPELLAPGRLTSPLEGNRIAEFLQGTVVSHEPGVPPGLALIGTSGRGQWEYSVDGGASWESIAEVAPDRAFLLGPTHTIRFVPRRGWAGRIQLTYRAWDRSTGEAGSRIDLSSQRVIGGASAFSEATTSVTVIVKAPPLRLSVAEPWSRPVQVADLVGEAAAVVRLEGCGIWQFSLDEGQSWTDFGQVFHGRARLLRGKDLVRFLPRQGESGRILLSARLWDGTGWGAGSLVNLAGHRCSGEGTAFGEIAQTRSWRLG